jgi:hypothetical protein
VVWRRQDKEDKKKLSSVLAAQHKLPKHVAVGTLVARLAFVPTDFRLQGRTLPRLIISLNRHRPAWSPRPTLSSIYVLISRVTSMGGLRVLHDDPDALAQLATLRHDKYCAAWNEGYGPDGMWDGALACAALAASRTGCQAAGARALA